MPVRIVDFLMFCLVSKSFELVIREVESVPGWTLLSKDMILLVDPIVIFATQTKIKVIVAIDSIEQTIVTVH